MAGDTPIEAKAAVRFAGLVVDVDACTLARDSGEHIALTRSEFALLRAFVGRPGRVISRETLLEATANRRFEPFDRSIDILISRLRRKIEPDPKQPRLIVTVPGEGYRFDGLKPAVLATPSAEERAADLPIETSSPLPAAIDHASRIAAKPSWRFRLSDMLAALSFVLLLALLGFVRHTPASGPIPTTLPGVIILPLANLTGDARNDYLGRALAFEVATDLGGYPGLRVVSAPASTNDPTIDVGHASGARYVVHGGLQRLRDLLRVSVTLYDGATRAALWSQVFDTAGRDALAPTGDVPRRIYDSLAGFRGQIHRNEERVAWSRPNNSLDEYDYYLRGLSYYLRSTLPDVLRARAIYQDGLERYPASTLLRIKLAWTYLWMAMNLVNSDPRPDIDQAWRLASEALSAPSHSPLEAWLAHWLMAFLYQWHDNDFSRSVAEARRAMELAPNDAYSRNDLSWILANAGYGDEAVRWARSGLDHDPNGPSRYHANLAWAYYIAGRDQEAFEALRERSAEFPVLFTALNVRIGEVEKARTLIAKYVKSGGRDTVEKEDIVPLVEPAGSDYVEVLRKAGLPEK